MKKISLILLLSMFITGCVLHRAQVEDDIEEKPGVNCSSARNDLKVLEDEKVGLAGQVASGVTMVTPAGLAIGILTGTIDTKFRVATGEYNDMLDNRIALIKRTCGL
jgi:PBP1b-binding outer membrane lipoprotein LpoB